MAIVIDPEVDHLTLIDRDGDGRRRVVLNVDADLSEPRKKTYKVTVIRRSSDGNVLVSGSGPGRSKRRKRKQSRFLKPMEKATRRSMRRGLRFMQDYLYLHDRSNQKKKNGWFKYYGKNVKKAMRRSAD
jgi:hypothetical protein